jgi:hypothetical protein
MIARRPIFSREVRGCVLLSSSVGTRVHRNVNTAEMGVDGWVVCEHI